jgi:hypothetical protein
METPVESVVFNSSAIYEGLNCGKYIINLQQAIVDTVAFFCIKNNNGECLLTITCENWRGDCYSTHTREIESAQ